MGRETVQTEIFRPGDLPEELRGMMDAAPDHVCQTDGKIYFALDEIVVCCPDDLSGRGLIYALMRHRNPEMKHLGELEALCFRILTDPRYAACPERISDRRLIQDAHRCVAVFQSDLPLPQKLSFAFASMVPSEKGDITVSIDFRTVAFIRQFNHSSEGELAEFCNAVIDTLETEGIVGLKAGIGMEVFDVQGLRDSYLQGLDALALGRKYFSREPVYVYHHQTLERIIDCIPPEKQREIRQQALRNRTYGKLSDEMLETVRVFFQNDLNLTAASRQLFIHRNTLNYRLDKIRKETGLDLRLFRDAVVFCVISALRDEIDG